MAGDRGIEPDLGLVEAEAVLAEFEIFFCRPAQPGRADGPGRRCQLAFHYCFVPDGQLLTKTRLIRAAGLRWPVEEDFEFGKDCFGLDQCQARLYTAILRHAVLVMAALAICAVTAALLKDRTGTQAPPPTRQPNSAAVLPRR